MSLGTITADHPVFDRVHRLAFELHSNQNREKFELCESLAALLNSIAQEEEGFLRIPIRPVDAQLFCQSLRDILGSKLSCELRRKALNLAAALFECYGTTWLEDTSSETHLLITLMTNLAAIEIRVALAKKSSFQELEAEISTRYLCAWLKIVHGSIYRLTNDDVDTKWAPERILSLQRCYLHTCQELAGFLDKILVDEDVETNAELREFLHSAADTITYWTINDFDSLEEVISPLLAKLAPICPRLRWTQPCLNIVARLDHETIASNDGSTSSPLIAQISTDNRGKCGAFFVSLRCSFLQVWDGNEELMQFTLQVFSAELQNMKITHDQRLVSITHFIFVEFDSLVVSNTRNVQEAISKMLTEWMTKKEPFQLYDAQVLMHLACLNIKLCQVNVENSTPFRVALACSIQILWVFCGFHKNNPNNKFRMPTIYKHQSEEVLPLLMESWCEATQVLAQLVRKNRFIAEFLYEHRIVHRALTVPLIGTIEMPEPMESVLQEFHQAFLAAYPEAREALDHFQENLLTGKDYNEL
ncbi:hypothetical protein BIW11_10083 [Tropilaelaps mercedesae]|uniref:Uncharacterized protein n=1 Tax=Tropilaelaps mercedesae TaxID=418985 RepID=A0A1V9XHN5_9ACAR|nr:hypothetical protein BIW11_10083 [Tropilaelaps mercedesae]